MRVLLVHESYRQRGGEDAVFEAERDLLASRGHEVVEYRLHNDAVERIGRVGLFLTTLWSRKAHRELSALVRAQRPDVAHFHNTLPLISPSGYAAAHAAGVPVVQTLHNYRFVCPSAILFKDGAACEACVGKAIAWPGIRAGCYRGSRAATAAVAATFGLHRALGTFARRVDLWIALSDFQKRLVARGGVPEERIALLPNFLAGDPGIHSQAARDGILFVGRLTEEKGVRTLLDAVEHLPAQARLTIAGDGPLHAVAAARAARDPRIAVLGALPPAAIDELMRRALVLALPSRWYEGLPMTVVEAYARGLPVVASAIGGLPELVRDGVEGLTVPPGDAPALAAALTKLLDDRRLAARLGAGGRARFCAELSADAHLDGLLAIYASARAARSSGRATLPAAPKPAVTAAGR